MFEKQCRTEQKKIALLHTWSTINVTMEVEQTSEGRKLRKTVWQGILRVVSVTNKRDT